MDIALTPRAETFDGAELLDEVRAWFARFISTVAEEDLDLLTLWAVHTHVVRECYTTPRLLIESPMPGSGKTTCLDHLHRLSFHPVQMSAVSSTALLVRLTEAEPRTLLMDEVDRTLRRDNPMTPDLLAVLNSGYRVGNTRPVLVPVKGGGWEPKEMSTFAPVAMAGNSPDLPDDTRSRCIRVLLMPDYNDTVDESDWEMIGGEADDLADRVADWSDAIREDLAAAARPVLPAEVTGRFREKWGPLRRVADIAGGRWPDVVNELAVADVDQHERDRADGAVREAIGVVLLRHLAEVWPDDPQPSATDLADLLATTYPEVWGDEQGPGRTRLSGRRFGKMMSSKWGINSRKTSDGNRRFYALSDVEMCWRRMGIDHPYQTSAMSDTSDMSEPTDVSDTSDNTDVWLGGTPSNVRPTCRGCGKPNLLTDASQQLGICLACLREAS